MPREFTITDAKTSTYKVPLLLAISGPTNSGKTYSALRLATGLRKILGGEIVCIDTEAGRALNYKQYFDFKHVVMEPPFSPSDYIAAIDFALSHKPGVLVIDQMTYEHSGMGGILQMHDAIMGDNLKKAQMAWIKPKAERQKLIQRLIQIGSKTAVILLFQSKKDPSPWSTDKDQPKDKDDLGPMPIGGAEYIFMATASIVLPVLGDGIPKWQSNFNGERAFMKLPRQFQDIFQDGRQLDEKIGEDIAAWSKGSVTQPPPLPIPPAAAGSGSVIIAEIGDTMEQNGILWAKFIPETGHFLKLGTRDAALKAALLKWKMEPKPVTLKVTFEKTTILQIVKVDTQTEPGSEG